MIALCSQTYILKKHDNKVKFSCKGLNKSTLKEPFASFQQVLDTGEIKSSTNQGFRTQDNTIFTYQQSKGGLSYFYCKREVMADGIHTKPLKITLTPWSQRQLELVDETHPWNLEKVRSFVIDGDKFERSLADVCVAAYQQTDMIPFMQSILCQLPTHIPKGKVIVALTPYLKKRDNWKHDMFWTTGLSPKSSLLRSHTPGQNKLGEMMEQMMLGYKMEQTHLWDHDYL